MNINMEGLCQEIDVGSMREWMRQPSPLIDPAHPPEDCDAWDFASLMTGDKKQRSVINKIVSERLESLFISFLPKISSNLVS